jgi:hypothetical protein
LKSSPLSLLWVINSSCSVAPDKAATFKNLCAALT